MAIDIILFVVGAALVIFGADWLVDGASAVARRAGLSEYAIGATIVGIGTSMPEFVVSAIASFQGSAGMAVGNVAGSNVFNTLLILGVTALILPLGFTRSNIRSDIPLCIGVSAALLAATLLFNGEKGCAINRAEGLVLLAGFAAYLVWCFKSGKDDGQESGSAPVPIWKMTALIAAGLGALIYGGELFVDSACNIARRAAVPESVIAATLMAGGTSLPELAVCVAAALKKREQMAIGNIIGSNISNILLIIGFAATTSPLPLEVDRTNIISISVALLSAVLLSASALPLASPKLSRWKGAIFIAIYAAYVAAIL